MIFAFVLCLGAAFVVMMNEMRAADVRFQNKVLIESFLKSRRLGINFQLIPGGRRASFVTIFFGLILFQILVGLTSTRVVN